MTDGKKQRRNKDREKEKRRKERKKEKINCIFRLVYLRRGLLQKTNSYHVIH